MVEVLASVCMTSLYDLNALYLFAPESPGATLEYFTVPEIDSNIYNAKLGPTYHLEDLGGTFDEPTPADHHRLTYSEVSDFSWAMVYRFGRAGSSTHYEYRGWYAANRRRDIFMDQAMTDLHSIVNTAAEIPKEYRIRMQQSPSFDTGKLTTMPTTAPGTATTPATSTGPTSPSGGSY